jgi:hypothetical protein
VADADFTGDDLGDTVNFAGANSFGLEGVDLSVARIGGRSTSGNFKLDFADAATAQSFLDVARTLNSYGAEVF